MASATTLHDPVPPVSVLLLAAGAGASTVELTLHRLLRARVTRAPNLRRCQEALFGDTYDLLLLEEALALENRAALEALSQSAGRALILEVNFGISDVDRVVRQVRSALARRAAEEERIKAEVTVSLRNELNASVTGLLLESQMALRKAGPTLAPSLQRVVALAEALCQQLRVP